MKIPSLVIAKKSLRILGLTVTLSFVCQSVAFAEPFLRIQFLADLKTPLEPQPDFLAFPIPLTAESEPGQPLSMEMGNASITVSGQVNTSDGKISEEPSKLVSRVRDIPPERQDFPYYALFRSWVGNGAGFSIQIAKLKSKKLYKVTFYAYDYSVPGVPRAGKDIIQDAINPSVQVLAMEWASGEGQDFPTADTPLTKYSGSIESTSSEDGRLLYTIEPEEKGSTALINAFEIEEVK